MLPASYPVPGNEEIKVYMIRHDLYASSLIQPNEFQYTQKNPQKNPQTCQIPSEDNK